MQIFLKTLDGRTLAFEVVKTTTIKELLQQYFRVLGVEGDLHAPEHRRIIYAGTVLELDRTFADYGIEKEATLHHVLPLRDCGCGCGGRAMREATEDS